MGPEHSHLVRDEWMDRFAVAGLPDEVRDKVRILALESFFLCSRSTSSGLYE